MNTKSLVKVIFSFAVLMLISSPQADAQIARQPEIKMLAADLAFGKIVRKNIHSVDILVINQGKVKSVETEGAFRCDPIKLDNGVGFGFSGLLVIKALAPGESWKVKMACGKDHKIIEAGLDGQKKVPESNEKNNSIMF